MRFAFGRNWQKFVSHISDENVQQATEELGRKLGVLSGLRFLDVGCGSGIHSLAAVRLGASVHSFDYDADSVSAAERLRSRFNIGVGQWTIEKGSALDAEYLRALGKFDVVYSWGVLHHTGAMWDALQNVLIPLAEGGRLFISIYNDQGWQSRVWRLLKQVYNTLPGFLRLPYAIALFIPFELAYMAKRGRRYFQLWRGPYGRGMTRWTDWIDWIGGYPFEVAGVEQIVSFYRQHGLEAQVFGVGKKLGCNEFLISAAPVPATLNRSTNRSR